MILGTSIFYLFEGDYRLCCRVKAFGRFRVYGVDFGELGSGCGVSGSIFRLRLHRVLDWRLEVSGSKRRPSQRVPLQDRQLLHVMASPPILAFLRLSSATSTDYSSRHRHVSCPRAPTALHSVNPCLLIHRVSD